MGPLKLLYCSSSQFNMVRSCRSTGSVPVSPFDWRRNWVTCPPLQVTPYQVHGVVVASQPLLLVQLLLLVALNSVTNALHSVAGIWLTSPQEKVGATTGMALVRGAAAFSPQPVQSRIRIKLTRRLVRKGDRNAGFMVSPTCILSLLSGQTGDTKICVCH